MPLAYIWGECTLADGSVGLKGPYESESDMYRDLGTKKNVINIKAHEYPTRDLQRAKKMLRAERDDMLAGLHQRIRTKI